MNASFPLVAKTVAGLEQVLASELTALGATAVMPGRRLVNFTGDLRLLYQANLCCRTAIRILRPIGQFSAASEQDLYRGVQAIEWPEWLDPEGTLAIDPIVHSSFLTHSLYAAQLTKDAIVDQFRARFNVRPSVDRDDPDLRINLHINQNQVSLYADSSGDSLHKRGYRTGSTEAPLSEVLAAGILALAGWDRASPVVDFMCGSGTFLIEAALAARQIAPGLIRREFGYMWWRDFDEELHRELLKEAKAKKAPALGFPLLGGDLDETALEIARANARKAGVEHDIAWEVANFATLRPPADSGLLVTNPPYDERLKAARIGLVYQRIGEVLKAHWRGYRAFIFTGNLEAAKEIGLKPERKTFLKNGPIECRLLEFNLWKKGPAVTAPTSKRRRPEVAVAAEPPILEPPATESPATESPATESPETESAELKTAWATPGEAPPAVRATPPASAASDAKLAAEPASLQSNKEVEHEPAGPASDFDDLDEIGEIEQSSPYDEMPDDDLTDDEEIELDEADNDSPHAEQQRSTPPRPHASSPASTTEPLPNEKRAGSASGGANVARSWADQAAAFRNRLARMSKHWSKWARRQNITCYRLYDRDVPEIPLAIDRYENYLAIAEYDRPHNRTDLEQRKWLDQMLESAMSVLQIPRERIFLKRRERQTGRAQYQKQVVQQAVLNVQEGGHRFEVNLSDYLDTGLFLDHRITRGLVEQEAAGKRVLNLFAYTGAFSVYAAAGGAASSVTVDLSNTYLDWAARNMQLNQLARPEHELVRDDAREFLRYYSRRRQPLFDLAIVDPPTFSKSKKTAFDWDVQRDHVELLQLVLERLQPGGKIYFSTNFRRFKFQPESLSGITIREISRQTVPPDFRNRRIHRCWTILKAEPPAA
ncbi:MAG TPA: class I SAM-dependent methyltransferase [Pirellulales bacterium]|nr:class I SAM-dependent methyltransferase [Pirellulales bacterium]